MFVKNAINYLCFTCTIYIYKLYLKIKIKVSKDIFSFLTKNISKFVQLIVNLKNKYFLSFKHIVLKFLQWFYLGFLLACIYIYLYVHYLQIELFREILNWYFLVITIYWIISTFTVIANKYEYGNFTTGVHRLWKRLIVCVWLIEIYLFSLFFFFYLTSSTESAFFYDISLIVNEYTYQLETCFKASLMLSFLLILSLKLLHNINYGVTKQVYPLLSLILISLYYMLCVEFYQIYYLLNKFSQEVWLYNFSTKTWVYEIKSSYLKVKQQYFFICLIVKFWHFFMIFMSWFFFFIRTLEKRILNYSLLSYNVQNLFILYLLNLSCLCQYLIIFFKKTFYTFYSFFFYTNNNQLISGLLSEALNIFLNIFFLDRFDWSMLYYNIMSLEIYFTTDLNYWKYI